EKLAVALRMYDSEEYSIKEIVSATGISQGSLYRAVNGRRLEEIKK
ncbi:resolvase, partial [Bacillus mycoides]